MAPAATDAPTCPSELSPASFILPDLVSACPYPLRISPHFPNIARASAQWLLEGARLVEPHATKIASMKAGELAAACYPNADAFHLSVCSDFMNWIAIMDELLDESDPRVVDTAAIRDSCMGAFRDPINFSTENLAGKMSKSFFSRFIQTGSAGCTERFIHAIDLYFTAGAKQAEDRVHARILDLSSITIARRDTGSCKTCFTFIEYAARIDLPDEVMSHPIILGMEEAANDFITQSNDIFSYNIEQAQHESHNLIAVLMHEKGLDLQSAVDYVGELCKASIQRFEEGRAMLPSWGEEVDQQVAIYVEGLQDWIVGTLHWSFDTERYFGKEGPLVKQTRIVKLLPKRPM
ncbi:isoprenoid synthase domain-containing protein [Melanogaster broomeanus]|nr:isoprenoid synthase domain-containing protein [Melanogaster broomeanus]